MYYSAKVQLIDSETLPNGKNREKKWIENYLVEAISVGDAEVIIHEEFKGSIVDWRITGVMESAIIGVLKKK